MPLTQKERRRREDSDENQYANHDIVNTVNEMSERLSNILEDKLSKILEAIIDLKEDVKIIKQKEGTNADTIIETISSTSTSLIKELVTIHQTQTSMLKNITTVGANTEQTLEGIIPNWRNILTKRKIEYWKYLRNSELANIYNQWLEGDPVTIPKKFQLKPVRVGSEFQKELKVKLATDQMKCEIELQKVHAKNHKQQFDSIDQQIAHKIEEKFPSNQDAVALLVSKWQSLCKMEEELSEEIWNKEEDWYIKQEIDSTLTNDSENLNDSNGANNDYSNSSVSTNHRQNPSTLCKTDRYRKNVPQRYMPQNRSNNSRDRPYFHHNNNTNFLSTRRLQNRKINRSNYQKRPEMLSDCQNSFTDLIAQNFPTSGTQRTISDPFLRQGRHPIGSRQ